MATGKTDQAPTTSDGPSDALELYLGSREGSLAEALAHFQHTVPRIEKGNRGTIPGKDGKQGYSYDYADLTEVTDKVLPLLAAVGLSWSAKPTLADGSFVLHYCLRHVSGETDEGFYPLPDPMRTPPQQVGSAITYAKRYALTSVTGVAPGGEDDDGAAAQSGMRGNGSNGGGQRPAGNGNGNGRQRPANGNGGQERARTAEQLSRDAQQAATALLKAETDERVEWLAGRVEQNGDQKLDCSAHVSGDDRETLGIGSEDELTLDDLLGYVRTYRAKHGHGPRQQPADDQVPADQRYEPGGPSDITADDGGDGEDAMSGDSDSSG